MQKTGRTLTASMKKRRKTFQQLFTDTLVPGGWIAWMCGVLNKERDSGQAPPGHPLRPERISGPRQPDLVEGRHANPVIAGHHLRNANPFMVDKNGQSVLEGGAVARQPRGD